MHDQMDGTLRLGKGSLFVKSQIRRLPQTNDVWEVGFHSLGRGEWLGMVLSLTDGYILACSHLESDPGVNDLANLLASAMRRPLVDVCHRPQTIRLQPNRKWVDLLRPLLELGIELEAQPTLTVLEREFANFIKRSEKSGRCQSRQRTPVGNDIGTTNLPTAYGARFTQAQRTAIAELIPSMEDRLLLDEPNQRTLPFSVEELEKVRRHAKGAFSSASSGQRRNTLRHIVEITTRVIDGTQGLGSIPISCRLFQFKITLLRVTPKIWRRIQTKDCTLDKLHEHIQTSMGWTNSHLHKFDIEGIPYGDPDLLDDGFDDIECEDSRATKLSEVLPKSGKRFRFQYEYDFGDGWEHEILFEGCLRAEPGKAYPVCIEGERACPPEDVGGSFGFGEFLEAVADPTHERHVELLQLSGPYKPNAFDPVKATKVMKRGLPDWRQY